MILFIFFKQITSSWFRLMNTHYSAIKSAEDFTRIGTHVLAHTCWHTCIGTHVLAHMYWHTSIGTHVLAHTYWHTCIGTHVLAHMYWHTCIGTHVLAHMYWHTRICYKSRKKALLNRNGKEQYTTFHSVCQTARKYIQCNTLFFCKGRGNTN